jgi:HPt (histidine-containing phosphotransfer) domain-containing protein
LVHAFKSALANIGAVKLSRVAASLEEAGRGGDLSFIQERLPAFRSELGELVSQIDRLTTKRSADGGEPEAVSVLENLKRALESKDIEAVDAALGRLQDAPLNGAERQAVTEIADLVLTADFQMAMDSLAALLERKGEVR